MDINQMFASTKPMTYRRRHDFYPKNKPKDPISIHPFFTDDAEVTAFTEITQTLNQLLELDEKGNNITRAIISPGH